MSVPSQLNFPKIFPVAAQAVSSKYSNVAVSGTSFSGGTTTSIDIQGSAQRAAYLDPSATMLRFTVNVTLTGGTTPTWATTAASCISAIALYSSAGANLVESVQQYGCLHHILRDLGTTRSKAQAADTITQGIDSTRPRSAVTNAASVLSRDFALPLVSCISALSAGSLYIPICELDSPLRLDVTWADPLNSIAVTGGPSGAGFSITNVYLDTQLITLADSVHQQLRALNGGVVSWSGSIWKSYRSVQAANQLSNSVLIPSRVDSAKSLFIAMRTSTNEFNQTYSSVTHRIRNSLTSWRIRSGAQYVTPNAVVASGFGLPSFIEAVRVMGVPASEASPTLMNSVDWVVDTDTTWTNATVDGSFVVGCELECFSQSQKLVSGLSTSANTLVADLTFSGTPLACNIDCFLESDAVFSIANGQLSVAF